MTTGREASIERRKSLSRGLGGPGSTVSQAVRRPVQSGASEVGRNASIERRRQLSSGKSAIGTPAPANEAGPKPEAKQPTAAPPAPAEPVAPTPVNAKPVTAAGGRPASIARRRQLSAGKTAIPGAETESGVSLKDADGSVAAGRQASKLRRGQLSAGKAAVLGKASPSQTDAAQDAAHVSESPDPAAADPRWAAVGRQGSSAMAPAKPGYPLKVISSKTHSGQQTTGVRIGPGDQVTGHEHGATLPVTGNQYYGEEAGATVRARPQKVGVARTMGGLQVSGTLVRSQVPITGDERGERIGITGEADQTLKDDLTPRAESFGGPQFPRKTDPHGHTAASSEFLAGPSGRSARRNAADPHEKTLKGYAVSGTAVGRSELMTGDEDGADRKITGTQYAAKPKAASAARTLEPPAQGNRTVRRDPVTGAKVVEAQTWGGQRVTGPAFEHVAQVTGSEAGSYVATTGTPYQGPGSVAAFLGPDAVPTVAERVIRQPAREAVTGDTPLNNDFVTGTQRGANRDITGTPYYREQGENAAAGNPIAEIDRAFTIATPQRKAQLRAAARKGESNAGEQVTGSFASGENKVTGAAEFHFAPRRSEEREPRVTGEGASAKNRITGDSWAQQSNVTGTEGYIAAGRNPTLRGPTAQRFAGASKFKHPERPDDELPVTGILTDKEDAALGENARITVSGGAAAS